MEIHEDQILTLIDKVVISRWNQNCLVDVIICKCMTTLHKKELLASIPPSRSLISLLY